MVMAHVIDEFAGKAPAATLSRLRSKASELVRPAVEGAFPGLLDAAVFNECMRRAIARVEGE
jgi:hypothetical protein